MEKTKVTKADALKHFRQHVLPGVEKTFGKDDVAKREEWNMYTDVLCREGKITVKQRDTWSNPF